MGNTRTFKPGRAQKRLSQKQQIRLLEHELAYADGALQATQAQLAATRMERPSDLEEWIQEVAIPTMDREEREAWDAMSDTERETFKDELGQRINATKIMAGEAGKS
jgi:hypothetical protein